MARKKTPSYTVQAFICDYAPAHQPHWQKVTPDLEEAIKSTFYT